MRVLGRDVQVPCRIDRHSISAVEVPRNRRDHSRPVYFPQRVVKSRSDEQVARRVHGHRCRPSDFCVNCQAAVPAVASHTCSRHRRDHSRRVHLAHALIEGVSDVQIANRVHRHAGGSVELGVGGRAAVPTIALPACARHRRDHSRRAHAAHAVIRGVGDIQVA